MLALANTVPLVDPVPTVNCPTLGLSQAGNGASVRATEQPWWVFVDSVAKRSKRSASRFPLLAGEIMNDGGLSQRIVNLAITLVGHKRGGLGFVAIVAACMLAALSGSVVADTAALAALLLPMMVKAGHDKARAGGLIASASITALVIPPSIGFVIFGVSVSISTLFLAGTVPGLMMGLSIAPAWWWVAKRGNVQPLPKASWAKRGTALRGSTWALVLPVIVIVGLKLGVFTPTEAAVVAGVYALVVATLVYRELAWLITVADIPAKSIELLQPVMGNQTLLRVTSMVLALVVGTAMDMTPTILIMTPVLMPVVRAAGIDSVYFGVLFIIDFAIRLITPSVGTVFNVVAGVAKLKMGKVTRGMLPFIVAEFAVMFLKVFCPWIVTGPAKRFAN